MGIGKNNPFAGNGLGNIAFSPDGAGSTNSRVSGESQTMGGVRIGGRAESSEEGPADPAPANERKTVCISNGSGVRGRKRDSRRTRPPRRSTVSVSSTARNGGPSLTNQGRNVAKESATPRLIVGPCRQTAPKRTRGDGPNDMVILG
jgi:hypothetical protein